MRNNNYLGLNLVLIPLFLVVFIEQNTNLKSSFLAAQVNPNPASLTPAETEELEEEKETKETETEDEINHNLEHDHIPKMEETTAPPESLDDNVPEFPEQEIQIR